MFQCRASGSRKMERVQERALRAVYSSDTRSSYDELFRKAKLTTLGCRRLQDIAIIMYKAKYNIILCPPYIKDNFKLDKPRYGFRNSGDFFIPRHNTTTYGRQPEIRGPSNMVWTKQGCKKRRFNLWITRLLWNTRLLIRRKPQNRLSVFANAVRVLFETAVVEIGINERTIDLRFISCITSRVIYVSMVAFPFFLPLISFGELTGSLIGQIYTHCLFFLFFQKGI